MDKRENTVRQRVAKGRGSDSCDTGRYEKFSYHDAHDGWDIEEEQKLVRTEVREEQARSIINYVRSPDLPFDRTLNPYRGCEHGCIYCFARPTHAYLNMSPGLDFETRLIARPNAPALLQQALRARSYRVAPIAIGTNTDPYQPIEREYGIMRGCLQVLQTCDHPVAIVTKGTLVERDIDILSDMAQRGLVRVGVSVTSLDSDLSRRMEPRCPAPTRRLQIIERLSQAGIEVRAMVSPLVPGLSDHELESILQACVDAGAQGASWIMLRLPQEVSGLWQSWLERHYPNHVSRVMGHLKDMHGGQPYSSQWHRRMRGQGAYAQMIQRRFERACRALGLRQAMADLRCDLFRSPELAGNQLQLF